MQGSSLRLEQKPPKDGQYVVAIALKPIDTRVSVAAFKQYLAGEGSPDAAARIEREGLLDGRDSVVYRTIKYAKATVEVGRGARAFKRTAGYQLELTPTSDPAKFRTGQTIKIQLTADGQPMSGFPVHAGAAADSVHRGSEHNMNVDQRLTSDAKGIVELRVDKPGWWNVRSSRVVPGQTALRIEHTRRRRERGSRRCAAQAR